MGFTRLLSERRGTIGGTRFIKDKDRILALRENRITRFSGFAATGICIGIDGLP